MKIYILFLFFIFLASPSLVSGINMFDVVFNEIAWMGTETSANDEWIELKNNTESEIDITGWTLQTADEKVKAVLKGTIAPNGFFLLERTDDSSVLNVPADQIYSGSLSNNGQDLWLYDTKNNIIDEADFYLEWTFGNNQTKQTMERINKENWQTSKNPGGTPKKENSQGLISQANESQPVVYPENIFINEFLPNPEGADETEEWVELYNNNNFPIDLSGWKIEDTQGTHGAYAVTKETIIQGFGFLTFKRPETKIMINNDADGLVLKNPDGKIIDSVSFLKAPLGQSYNKTDLGWQWSQKLTLGEKNSIVAEIKKISLKTLPKEKNSVKNIDEAGTANINLGNVAEKNQDLKKFNPWFLFFIALSVTVISASALLFIKFKLLKRDNNNTN